MNEVKMGTLKLKSPVRTLKMGSVDSTDSDFMNVAFSETEENTLILHYRANAYKEGNLSGKLVLHLLDRPDEQIEVPFIAFAKKSL